MKYLILIFISLFLSSYKIPKEVDDNAKNIMHKCLIWRYGHSSDDVYILGYDHENSYIKNGKIRYDLKVFKLDFEKSLFISASKSLDYVEKTKWAYHSIPDGFEMVKYGNNKYTGGSANIKILDNDYILIIYRKDYLINDEKDKSYNSIVLLKYNKGNWNIESNNKYITNNMFIMEQSYFNPNTNDRELLVYNDDISIKIKKENNKYIIYE